MSSLISAHLSSVCAKDLLGLENTSAKPTSVIGKTCNVVRSISMRPSDFRFEGSDELTSVPKVCSSCTPSLRSWCHKRRLITSTYPGRNAVESRPLIGTDHPPLVSQSIQQACKARRAFAQDRCRHRLSRDRLRPRLLYHT